MLYNGEYVNQLEIKFFWPLTEQIELDLDFTESINFNLQKIFKENQQSIGNYVLGGTGGTTGATWATARNFHLELDHVTIGLDKPVPWYRKKLYKLLGMKVIEK